MIQESYGHPLQYAFVGRIYVYETGNLSDDQVRDLAGNGWLPVERFNRCPTCEEWSPCDFREQARAAGKWGA